MLRAHAHDPTHRVRDNFAPLWRAGPARRPQRALRVEGGFGNRGQEALLPMASTRDLPPMQREGLDGPQVATASCGRSVLRAYRLLHLLHLARRGLGHHRTEVTHPPG